MEYITIYEYTATGNKLLYLIPLVLFILFGFGLVYYVKKYFKTYSIFRQILLYFGYILLGFSLIFAVVTLIKLPSMISKEKELQELVKNENYKIVEGLTKNFKSSEEGAGHFESFSVKGIEFRYSDHINIQGFHKTAGNGGPINKNGLQVKIGYTKIDNKNVILKLEIAK